SHCQREPSGQRTDPGWSSEAPARLESHPQLPFRKRSTSRVVRFWGRGRADSFSFEIAGADGRKGAVKIPSDGCTAERIAVQRISPLVSRQLPARIKGL